MCWRLLPGNAMKRSYLQRKPAKVRGPSLNHPDRTALPPSKPVAASKPKKRARINPVSAKRKKWNAEYRHEKITRGDGPHACIVCSTMVFMSKTGSWHHPSGRRTRRTLLFFVPICEIPCHRKVHADENWAMENGFLTKEFRNYIDKSSANALGY